MELRLINETAEDITDKIREAISGVEYTDEKGDVFHVKGWKGASRAGVQIWWHPAAKRIFLSVGDWADYKPWSSALEKVVGNGKVDVEYEAGPPKLHDHGGDWLEIKESGEPKPYKRHRYSMKVVGEGVVAAARGDIINIVNDLASKITRVAESIFMSDRRMVQVLGMQRPTVEFSDREDDPAIVTIRIGRRVPQAISIVVYGDGGGEIRFEMTEQLSKLLALPRTATLSSEAEVNHRLGTVVGVIQQRLAGQI